MDRTAFEPKWIRSASTTEHVFHFCVFVMYAIGPHRDTIFGFHVSNEEILVYFSNLATRTMSDPSWANKTLCARVVKTSQNTWHIGGPKSVTMALLDATTRLALQKRVAVGGTTTAPRLDDFGFLELCLHQHVMVLTPVKFFAALRTVPLRAIDRKVVTMATSCGVLRTS